MSLAPSVTTEDEITLITLQNCPPELSFVSRIFGRIGSLGVDVDMISLAPSQGSSTSISFTLRDSDLDKMLSFTSQLQEKEGVKAVVSSGNYKISICDSGMVNAPGFAARIFAAAESVPADIRIITTSEVSISLLVTAADFAETLSAIRKELA